MVFACAGRLAINRPAARTREKYFAAADFVLIGGGFLGGNKYAIRGGENRRVLPVLHGGIFIFQRVGGKNSAEKIFPARNNFAGRGNRRGRVRLRKFSAD